MGPQKLYVWALDSPFFDLQTVESSSTHDGYEPSTLFPWRVENTQQYGDLYA